MDEQMIRLLHRIADAIRKAGFDPYEQITGYVRTGNELYITRTDDARELIKQVDRVLLKDFAAYLKSKK